MKVLTVEEIEKMQKDPQFIRDMTKWQYECAKAELERLNPHQYSGLAEVETVSVVHKSEKENKA